MRRTAGIGISLVLVLSLAVAAFVVYDAQTAGGPGAGATGAGWHILLDLEELVIKSDLVVLGEVESSEIVTKTAPDTSPPVDLRGEDYTIEVSRISFTVDEYLKGSGGDTVTITTSAGEDSDPHGTDNRLAEGTKYVVFLFDPNLLPGGDFWGDTYLTLGPQGIWQVSGSEAERRSPSKVLTLDSLRSEVSDASGR